MYVRVPPSGHGQAVGRDTLAVGKLNALECVSSPCVDHRAATHETGTVQDAVVARRRQVPRVYNRRNLDTCRCKIARGAPAIVVVGKHCDPPAGRHTKTIDVGAHSTREHDPRSIVVGEGYGTLDCTGTQHATRCSDAPQNLSCTAFNRTDVISDAFERAVDAVVIGPVHAGACHQAYVAHAAQGAGGVRSPHRGLLAIDTVAFGIEPATRCEVLIAQDHSGSGTSSGQCCCKTRGARADDQQVCKQKSLVIAVRVRLHGQTTESCGMTDSRLVDFFPECLGPHEGLVVKTRRKQWRRQIVDGHEIVAQRAAPILTASHKPVVQLLHRCAHIRITSSTTADLDQCIGLFNTGRDDAARAVILE